MPARRWAIWHCKHDGTIEGQISPENLHITWNKGENGPHELTYDVPAAYPGFDVARINPYNEDFRLVLDDVPIMGGIVTAVSFESEQDYASIAAKDWLHYLEKRFYPFDPLNPNFFRYGDPPRGLAYEVRGEEVTTIVEVLLSQTLSVPNSLPITWAGHDPSDPYNYSAPAPPPPPDGLRYMVVGGAGWTVGGMGGGSWWSDFPGGLGSLPLTGTQIDYEISLADTETILSKIQQLSQQDPGIFDFWIDMNKVFHMAVPRQYNPATVLADATTCQWAFRDSDSGLLSVKWTNNGPSGTHLFGHGSETDYSTDTSGAETSDTVSLGLNMDDPVTQNVYRRLDTDEDFGDVPNRARINALTKGYFPRTNNPSYEVTIEVFPDAVDDFFKGRIFPGCAVWLDYEHPAYHINSAFEVVSIEAEINTETEEMVTLNLNQVYPLVEEEVPWIFPPGGYVVPMPPVTEPPQITVSSTGTKQFFPT